MAIAAPSLVYVVNNGSPTTLAPNASASIAPGVLLTLSLATAVGVGAATITVRAPGTILDGQNFAITPPAGSVTFQTPVTPTTYKITLSVTDGENITASVFSLVAAAVSIPNGLKAQAPISNGDGTYTPAGARSYLNVLTFGADPTGTFDSSVAFQAAIDAANGAITVYVPPKPTGGPGDYRFSQPIFLKVGTILETDSCPRGQPVATLRQNDATGLYWGGGHIGPIVMSIASSLANTFYTTEGAFTWLQMGGSSPTSAHPHYYLAEVPMGSFAGMAAMQFEFRWEAPSNPAGLVAIFYVGGSRTANSPLTSAFSIGLTSSASPTNIYAKLTTTGNPGGVTATSAGNQVTYGVDHAVMANYDGTTFRLYLDGTQVASVAATGTIVQNWWEEAVFGQSGGTGQYPMGSTSPFDAIASRIAEIRKSQIARVTGGASYTPKATKWAIADCDANTDLIISFDPAFVPTRAPSMVVAGCGHPNDYNIILAPPCNVWTHIRGVVSQTDPGSGGLSVISNLGFLSASDCISIDGSNGVHLFFLTLAGTRCVTRFNNSYLPVDRGLIVGTNGGPASPHPFPGAHSWGLAYIGASGAAIVDDISFSGSLSNWGIVFNGCGGTVKNPAINNTAGQGAMYINNGEVFIWGGGFGDEGPGFHDSPLILTEANGGQGRSFSWLAGLLFEANGAVAPMISIDGFVDVTLHGDFAGVHSTAILGTPSGGNPPQFPVKILDAYQGAGLEKYIPWSDGTLDCVVEPHESAVRSTFNSSATSITCMWGFAAGAAGQTQTGPDFSCSTLVLTGSPAGDVTLTAPTKSAGHRRRIVNSLSTAHNVIFGAATGATVTVANLKGALVESNGSGWERVTADT